MSTKLSLMLSESILKLMMDKKEKLFINIQKISSFFENEKSDEMIEALIPIKILVEKLNLKICEIISKNSLISQIIQIVTIKNEFSEISENLQEILKENDLSEEFNNFQKIIEEYFIAKKEEIGSEKFEISQMVYPNIISKIRQKLDLKNVDGYKMKIEPKNNLNIKKNYELFSNKVTLDKFTTNCSDYVKSKICINLYNQALEIFKTNDKIYTLDPRNIIFNPETLEVFILDEKVNTDELSFAFKNKKVIVYGENCSFMNSEDRFKSIMYSVGAIIHYLFEQNLLWTFSDEITNVTSPGDNYYSIYKKYDCVGLVYEKCDKKLLYIFQSEFDYNDPQKYFIDYDNEEATEFYLKLTNGIVDLSELLGYF